MPTQFADVPTELQSDFDIVADPKLMRDPQQRMAEVFLEDERDIVFTPHNGGHWVISNYEYAQEILKNPQVFGSFPIGVPANYEQRPRLIPLESAPDEHARYRRLLLPVFEPNTIRKMEDKIRQRTLKVLDEALTDGEIDFLWDIAKPIPTGVFLDMMGLPHDMQAKFFEWEKGFYRAPTIEERTQCGQNISIALSKSVDEHLAQPQDDVITLLLDVEVEGEKLSREEVDAICYLLFLAGVDTVATMLGFIAQYLAKNPALFQELKADISKLPKAVDELVRMQAFINLNRICEEDIEFHGVKFRKGDNIVIPTYVSDHDARNFPNPSQYNTERSKQELNMHHAFGDGPHKCIGMHLAKLEIRIVLEEMMKRMDTLEIADPDRVTAHGGTTMGLDSLPIHFQSRTA